jgi:hypothetical protein
MPIEFKSGRELSWGELVRKVKSRRLAGWIRFHSPNVKHKGDNRVKHGAKK